MKTKWSFLMVLVLLATLVGGSAGAARAQGGISDVSPVEGTVGTQVTITGSDFGEKLGEVLIGSEKCKVLAWSDASISCVVQKPQSPGYYPVTVLLQGDKKPADPLTFEGFAMRRPKIIPGADPVLVPDGETLTIKGEFFGDKKGDLRLAYLKGGPGGEPAVVNLKIVDWNMDTIRFELPGGLTGKFVLAVSNEVGAGLALLDLGGDQPSLVGYAPPPITPGYGNLESKTNSSGVYFKGKFYVFGTGLGCWWSWCNPPIQVWTISNNTMTDGPTLGVKGETNATPVPLVVGDELWLFHTAGDGRILYQIFDGTSWDAQWHQVAGGTKGDWEVAPVYNPVTHRVSVYYENSSKFAYSYSDNLGDSWTGPIYLSGSTLGTPSAAPSAVYYQPSGAAYNILLAVRDSSGNGKVYGVKDGTAVSELLNFGKIEPLRPFLMDDQGSGFIALIYAINTDPLGNQLKNQVFIRKMAKGTGSWGAAQEVYLPSKPPYGEGHYYFCHYWPPNGAINYEPDSSGDRIFYVYYGYAFSSYEDNTVTDAAWVMVPFDDLDD